MNISYRHAKWLMLALVAVETASSTFLFTNWKEGAAFLSILFFVCGIAVSILPLFYYRIENELPLPAAGKLRKAGVIVFFTVALCYCIPALAFLFKHTAIDYHTADMLPHIKVLATRWLNGEEIYKPIAEVWSGAKPTYLPMMWSPYIPALLLNIDMRWTTVIFYFLTMGLFLWMLVKAKGVSRPQFVVMVLLIANLIYMQTDPNKVFFTMTEEGVIVGFYILLCYLLMKRNSIALTAIAITCCLLSRYSLLFWVPFYLLFMLLTGQKKKGFLVGAITLVLATCIFVIPYFLKDPAYFIHVPDSYAVTLSAYWKVPHKFDHTLGFAKFFQPGAFMNFHYLDLIMAFIVPALFYITLYIIRNKVKFNMAFAGICGLKLSLTFFYNFIEAPFFYYLFMVPIVFSYVLLLHFFNPQFQRKIN